MKPVTSSPVSLLLSQLNHPPSSHLSAVVPFSSPSIIYTLSSKCSQSSLWSSQLVFVPSSSLEQFVSCEIKKKFPAPKEFEGYFDSINLRNLPAAPRQSRRRAGCTGRSKEGATGKTPSSPWEHTPQVSRCLLKQQGVSTGLGPPDGWPESPGGLLSFPVSPSEETQGRLDFGHGAGGRNRMECGSQRGEGKGVSGAVGHQ